MYYIDLLIISCSFGVILTELCCRKALLQFGSISLGKVIYDEDVSEGYIEVRVLCSIGV